MAANDTLRFANRVDIPLNDDGGAGAETFDASAVAGIITTFVGPNSKQPSLFDNVEVLRIGYIVFLPGAGVSDANGHILDFSRLGYPIDANFDVSGINVNNRLAALRVDLAIGSLFTNNRILPPSTNATNFLGRKL